MTARPEPFPVAASTPAQTPPSGGDWIPVSTDGAWWWDGRRWETTVQSPWPTPPTVVLVGPAGQRARRSGAALLATVVALPFRVAWFLLPAGGLDGRRPGQRRRRPRPGRRPGRPFAPLMRTCLAAAALVVGLAACSPGSAGAPSALTSVGATTSSAGGTAGSPAPPGSCHAGDGGFLPDPGCTPGGADARVTPDTLSSTICRSGYTATVRPPLSVTEPIKRERMAAYGLSAPLSAYELDHLVSGGHGGDDAYREITTRQRHAADVVGGPQAPGGRLRTSRSASRCISGAERARRGGFSP